MGLPMVVEQRCNLVVGFAMVRRCNLGDCFDELVPLLVDDGVANDSMVMRLIG
jgi:hypothetical protein